MTSKARELDICIVGGCGRAGLPLALAFGRAGKRVGVYDVDRTRVALVSSGEMPFDERGAAELLPRLLAEGCLEASSDPAILRRSNAIVIIVGTPIDEFLNPSLTQLRQCVDDIVPHLQVGSLVVLRSTVYPGTAEWLQRHFAERGVRADVAMCPERITEGFALEEIGSLPQIIGADDPEVSARAEALFRPIVESKMIRTRTQEAELAKLLTNAWRYMKFAIANHFFMIADSQGLNYQSVLRAVREDYPRAADLPGPGFAAGPCLLKDTMQLAAFGQNALLLAQAAMVVNEGLPNYIVGRLERRTDVRGAKVGLLGMAFKSESDDPRASLSYKLKKLLVRAGATVLCSDPYVREEGLLPLDEVVSACDVLIIGAPHEQYAHADLSGKDVVDIWALRGGIRV